MDSSYALQLSPCPKMLGAVVEHRRDGVQSPEKVLKLLRLRPDVAAM